MPFKNILSSISPISEFKIPCSTISFLDNGIKVHSLQDNEASIVKIDFIFEAGTWYQECLLQSLLANSLLLSGTSSFSEKEIAEKLDFYGAWVQLSNSYRSASFSLFALPKFLKETLTVVESTLKHSEIPESAFFRLLEKQKQSFLLSKKKVKVQANKLLNKNLWGENNPYGWCLEIADFEKITVGLVRDFYHRFYTSDNCQIVVTGNVTDEILSQLNSFFGGKDWGGKEILPEPKYAFEKSEQKEIFQSQKDAVQSAVCLGCETIPQTHQDYDLLRFVIFVLGGYFGSRLSSVIREEKGFTYGITARCRTTKDISSIVISTETATQYVKPLIDEVFVQIRRLQQELMSEEELQMAKNYALGEIARSSDGLFQLSELYISLMFNQGEVGALQHFIETIQTITAEEIQFIANRYLNVDDFICVVVG